MMALGVTFSDAAQATKWILANAPEDANLDTWLPTPAQLDAAAAITDADIADARAEWLIRPDNAGRWQFILDAVAEQEVTEVGVAGQSGNFRHAGVKGQLGGSAPGGGGLSAQVRLSQHAFQRTAERHQWGNVKRALRAMEGKPTPEGEWFAKMGAGEPPKGYLVGEDGVVKTVLGGWYNPAKLRGEEVPLAEAGGTSQLSVTKSIRWHLARITQAQVDAYTELVGLERMTPAEFSEWWDDWTWDGLFQIMWARGEMQNEEPSA